VIALNASRLIAAVGGKSFTVPKGGWTAGTFASHGHLLILTLTRVAKIVQRREAGPVMAKLHKVFTNQLNQVMHRAQSRAGTRAAKADVEVHLTFEQNSAIWAQALKEVFEATHRDIAVELMPNIQSVMAQGYSKVNVMLGSNGKEDASAAIATRARGVADKITRINDTTRAQFDRIIRDSVADGHTGSETARHLHDTFTMMESPRIVAIARTELANAWSDGAKQSFRDEPSITHVSVIGCESREEDRWGDASFQEFMYRGEGTCNIEDVPIADVDALNFHPNHTGVIVPSGFRD